MDFSVVPPRTRPRPGGKGVYLEEDRWNDYGFVTMYHLWYVDTFEAKSIGEVKFGRFGMRSGSPDIPPRFQLLGGEFSRSAKMRSSMKE